MDKPQEVRVKKYNNGYAVELKYGNIWKNLHAEVFEFPDSYYFSTNEEAEKVKRKIESLMK